MSFSDADLEEMRLADEEIERTFKLSCDDIKTCREIEQVARRQKGSNKIYPETRKKYQQEHKEQVNENSKRWRDNNREKVNAYAQQYRKDKAENRKAYMAEYKERNKEALKAYQKEYNDKNRETRNAYYKERYASKKRKELAE